MLKHHALRRARGFTLIEMMIVVAIVGIVTAIAYPSYRSHVFKGKRAEGRQALMDTLMQQERVIGQTGSYVAFTAGQTGTLFRTVSQSGGYQIKAEVCDASTALNSCVLLTAIPVVADPDAGNLTLSSNGPTRGCTGTNPSLCWP